MHINPNAKSNSGDNAETFARLQRLPFTTLGIDDDMVHKEKQRQAADKKRFDLYKKIFHQSAIHSNNALMAKFNVSRPTVNKAIAWGKAQRKRGLL